MTNHGPTSHHTKPKPQQDAYAHSIPSKCTHKTIPETPNGQWVFKYIYDQLII